MMQKDFLEFRDRLEPGVATADRAASDVAAMSLAISMKRIADMLDGTTIGIDVTETIFNRSR